MSRSRRKNPICGVTTAKSEKWDKKKAHRKERRKVKQALIEDAEDMPHKNEFYNPWNANKDGKQRISEDSDYYEKVLRK